MRITQTVLIAATICLPLLSANAGQRPSPSQWIQKNADKVLAIENIKDPKERYNEAQNVVQNFVDMQTLSSFACARYCRLLTEDQKELFNRNISEFTATAYALSMPVLSNMKWDIVGHDDDVPLSATVQFTDNNSPSQSIMVKFLMRATMDGYKITDIMVSDISFAQKLKQTVTQAFVSADTTDNALKDFSIQTNHAKDVLFGVTQRHTKQENLGEL